MWEFACELMMPGELPFPYILNNSIQTGDGRINRGGTIYTRPLISGENIIK
jgi:hypothetical protein